MQQLSIVDDGNNKPARSFDRKTTVRPPGRLSVIVRSCTDTRANRRVAPVRNTARVPEFENSNPPRRVPPLHRQVRRPNLNRGCGVRDQYLDWRSVSPPCRLCNALLVLRVRWMKEWEREKDRKRRERGKSETEYDRNRGYERAKRKRGRERMPPGPCEQPRGHASADWLERGVWGYLPTSRGIGGGGGGEVEAWKHRPAAAAAVVTACACVFRRHDWRHRSDCRQLDKTRMRNLRNHVLRNHMRCSPRGSIAHGTRSRQHLFCVWWLSSVRSDSVSMYIGIVVCCRFMIYCLFYLFHSKK